MLFKYPIQATIENWVHDCLIEVVKVIHESINAGSKLPAWPLIVPAAYRDDLTEPNRPGLRKRIDIYIETVKLLTNDERARVLEAAEAQNKIASLLSGECDCEGLQKLPISVHKPVKELFEFGFHLLGEFELRDELYWLIHKAMKKPICPFCGLEYFNRPEGPREALDHYLAKSKYPFAGANLRNLVPMGYKCNSEHKRDQDVLWRTGDIRRTAFDPYSETPHLEISLNNSLLFAGEDNLLPLWSIDFSPNTPEIETWDEVFHIRVRYIEEVLNPLFLNWIKDFGEWYWIETSDAHPDNNELTKYIAKYIVVLRSMNLTGQDFLREPVFRMIQKACLEEELRLFALIRRVIDEALVKK